MVVQVVTDTEVDPLRAELAAIEAATGRTRDDPRICRLDLDLLAYGGRVDAAQRLPRPGLYSLPFVLVPLAEIAPRLVASADGRTLFGRIGGGAALAGLENLGRARDDRCVSRVTSPRCDRRRPQ